ncbi:uncharacterized protein LOC144859584 isoform X3 [Branchiostoma floridae x Branchiostoma japonicum]
MAASDQKPHVSTVRPRSYQDESYLHGFLGTVGDLHKAGEFQDVVLEVEGRRFPCHRLVLSAASPYFRAMFTSDMAESRQKTVVLQGLDAGMFGEILSYIYSGTLHVSLDKVQPLYQAADLLQLNYVRDTCSSYMAMNVERSTCVDLYKFADDFFVDIVQKQCLQWIARHFTEFSFNGEFYSLSVNQLTEIISHDELDVKDETAVWEAVVRWVQHSREDRLHHLPSILPHIRFNFLTSDDTAAILEHPLIREDPGSSEVIRNVAQKRNNDLKSRLGMTTEMVLLSVVKGHFIIINMAAADQEPHVSEVLPSSYQDESYLRGFLGTVGDLQKAGAFHDVVLEVEGQRFPCHRLVLSAASPYVRAMFTSDMAESRQTTVVLQGLDAGMFEEILSYIYSGTLHVSLDKVQPLYQAADLLQLDYVRDTCSNYMAMNVERSNCVDLYKFADVFSVDIVQKACLQLIHRNFVEVTSSEVFCSLSVNQLTEIISQDELDVKEETTVWEALVRWVQHSREDRLHHLPSILPHIRFNLLTSDDTAAILEHPLVTENPGSSEVIRNVVQAGNPNPKPRLGMTTEMAILFNADSSEILGRGSTSAAVTI